MTLLLAGADLAGARPWDPLSHRASRGRSWESRSLLREQPGEKPLLGWRDQAAFDRPGGDLGARGEAELAEDVADVGLDGGFGDDQPFGDLAVGPAARDQAGDFPFPCGEPAELL